jgi:hypothetical protein
MKKEIYAEYMKAIEAFKNGKQPSFNEDVLPENANGGWAKEITITCKNYEIQGGMSHTLHNAKKDDIFQIKALMGKGLELENDGTYLVFVGGTGILVFLDLISLMIRHSLGLLSPG